MKHKLNLKFRQRRKHQNSEIMNERTEMPGAA